jgi:hypothetical protein
MGKICLLFKSSRLVWRPPSLLPSGQWRLFPRRVKWLGSESDHSPPSNAEFKIGGAVSSLPICLNGVMLNWLSTRTILPFLPLIFIIFVIFLALILSSSFFFVCPLHVLLPCSVFPPFPLLNVLYFLSILLSLPVCQHHYCVTIHFFSSSPSEETVIFLDCRSSTLGWPVKVPWFFMPL